MYVLHKNILAGVFESYCIRNNATHAYETWRGNLFRILQYEADLGERRIGFVGVKLWMGIIKFKIDVECAQHSVFLLEKHSLGSFGNDLYKLL